MIDIGGAVIFADVHDIIKELQSELRGRGIALLSDVKDVGQDVMISCPVHSGGMERRASCGVSKYKKETSSGTVLAGTVHCFACGYSGSFSDLISKCYGHDDFGLFGQRWLLERFYLAESDEREVILPETSRAVIVPESFVSEQELARFSYYHPYMYKRKLTDDVIELFDVGYDADSNSLTFPVRDLLGRVVFIQRRAVAGKSFLNTASASRGALLYGMFEYHKKYPQSDELWVCESIIDALTVWSTLKKPAVALMGAVPTDAQVYELIRCGARSLVFALDNDEAGRRGCFILKRMLGGKKLTFRLEIPDGFKDVNAMPSEALLSAEKIIY